MSLWCFGVVGSIAWRCDACVGFQFNQSSKSFLWHVLFFIAAALKDLPFSCAYIPLMHTHIHTQKQQGLHAHEDCSMQDTQQEHPVHLGPVQPAFSVHPTDGAPLFTKQTAHQRG